MTTLEFSRPTGYATRRAAALLVGVLVLGFVSRVGFVRAADTVAVEETAALTFVQENHPELAALLASLKPMRPEDYKKAVRDLGQVSRALTRLKQNNPERYALSLETWKARSRVEVIAAKLASAEGSTADLEADLRRAVASQLDAEVREQRFEKQVAEERLKKVSDNLQRLESRREAVAESRFQTLVRRGQNARRKATANAKSKPTVKPNATIGPHRDDPKGESPR